MKPRNLSKIMGLFEQKTGYKIVELSQFSDNYILTLDYREIVFDTQYKLLCYLERRLAI